MTATVTPAPNDPRSPAAGSNSPLDAERPRNVAYGRRVWLVRAVIEIPLAAVVTASALGSMRAPLGLAIGGLLSVAVALFETSIARWRRLYRTGIPVEGRIVKGGPLGHGYFVEYEFPLPGGGRATGTWNGPAGGRFAEGRAPGARVIVLADESRPRRHVLYDAEGTAIRLT